MTHLTFKTKDNTLLFKLTQTGKRWKVECTDPRTTGKEPLVLRKNVTDETAWQLIKAMCDGNSITKASSNQRKELGIEWAAIRMLEGSRPVIAPMRRGNWLYVERVDIDVFEIRIVEPLGTRRTHAVRASKTTTASIISRATERQHTSP